MDEKDIIAQSPLLTDAEKGDISARLAQMPVEQQQRILRVLVAYEEKIAEAMEEYVISR